MSGVGEHLIQLLPRLTSFVNSVGSCEAIEVSVDNLSSLRVLILLVGSTQSQHLGHQEV